MTLITQIQLVAEEMIVDYSMNSSLCARLGRELISTSEFATQHTFMKAFRFNKCIIFLINVDLI